ncbi:MAG TPA: M28 family metallopeptidase [Anaerolineae bacterium]|nr:M28 family metallopeptidase [Anaerolineae bacterium]HOQ97329.1 M28 family metallopeptidase [Anaerolineae bacterium]HOQ97340.1 M28 family metallopeptidase [Anaerolineae bacterium]HPL27304.1 M28 family metallopeptidase [Anaerolineae bacterium]
MSRSTTPMAHLTRLVELGPRPVGSPAHGATAGYIADVLGGLGYEVERQAWPFPSWQEEETQLTLGGEALAAAANGFSPSCDVAAPFVALGTLAELAAAELAGRIAVLYGELTREPLAPKANRVYNPPAHQALIRELEAKAPLAAITVNPSAGSLARIITDWELAIPSVTVPAEVGRRLLGQAGAEIHLRIASRRGPGEACNVVARRPGTRRERLVLAAHYDTAIDAPGAVDNASGVAVLLAIAERLARGNLRLGVELVAFGDEESGGHGDELYLQHYGLEAIPVFSGLPTPRDGERLGYTLAAINVDGVGQAVGVNTVTSLACSEAFGALVASVAAAHPGVSVVAPWPASNHYTFFSHGVPAVALGSVGVANIMHTPADTADWVSGHKLDEALALVAELLAALQDKDLDWCRSERQSG